MARRVSKGRGRLITVRYRRFAVIDSIEQLPGRRPPRSAASSHVAQAPWQTMIPKTAYGGGYAVADPPAVEKEKAANP